MKQKLNILIVLNSHWSSVKGFTKVHYDLKSEYEILGHNVDYIDFGSIGYDNSGVIKKVFSNSYQNLFLEKLKLISKKYDVIDANFDCIPFPKESFGFKGVLLYRSHGLQPLYRIAEQSPLYKKMEYASLKRNFTIKNKIGNFIRFLTNKNEEWILWDCIKFADIVHCLNSEEFNYLRKYGLSENKLSIIPNGISKNLLNSAKISNSEILDRNEISFVGSWTLRKGINDLPFILKNLPSNINRINFLGTGYSEEYIRNFFPKQIQEKLNIIIKFDTNELSNLLHKTKIAIFPSYIEGFPLAILEQLALGIPVLAYDIPGVNEALSEIDSRLLIETGNIELFNKSLINLYSMNDSEYEILVSKCFSISQNYNYFNIAKKFEKLFFDKLEELC